MDSGRSGRLNLGEHGWRAELVSGELAGCGSQPGLASGEVQVPGLITRGMPESARVLERKFRITQRASEKDEMSKREGIRGTRSGGRGHGGDGRRGNNPKWPSRTGNPSGSNRGNNSPRQRLAIAVNEPPIMEHPQQCCLTGRTLAL